MKLKAKKIADKGYVRVHSRTANRNLKVNKSIIKVEAQAKTEIAHTLKLLKRM